MRTEFILMIVCLSSCEVRLLKIKNKVKIGWFDNFRFVKLLNLC